MWTGVRPGLRDFLLYNACPGSQTWDPSGQHPPQCYQMMSTRSPDTAFPSSSAHGKVEGDLQNSVERQPNNSDIQGLENKEHWERGVDVDLWRHPSSCVWTQPYDARDEHCHRSMQQLQLVPDAAEGDSNCGRHKADWDSALQSLIGKQHAVNAWLQATHLSTLLVVFCVRGVLSSDACTRAAIRLRCSTTASQRQRQWRH